MFRLLAIVGCVGVFAAFLALQWWAAALVAAMAVVFAAGRALNGR